MSISTQTMQLKSTEEQVIRTALRRYMPNLRVDKLEASPAIEKNENFIGIITKIDVFGHNTEREEPISTCLIMKTLPEDENLVKEYNTRAAFSNEANFFNSVMPALERLDKVNVAPCLHAAPDMILLRHLGQDGYKVVNRVQGLDLPHCELVMRELGRFHATSLALKCNDPLLFELTKSKLKEPFIVHDNKMLNQSLDNIIDLALKVAGNMESRAVKTLKAIKGHGIDALIPFIEPEEPLAVICHGDLWNNNILFKYSDKAQPPTDVKFVDLQACRYASPALDIMYFLFSSTKQNVTKLNFRQLVATYHRSLEDHLQRMAPKAPTVTLEDIMKQMQKNSVFGLTMSLGVLLVIASDKLAYDAAAMTQDQIKDKAFVSSVEPFLLNAEFRRRVNEMFDVFEDKPNWANVGVQLDS